MERIRRVLRSVLTLVSFLDRFSRSKNIATQRRKPQPASTHTSLRGSDINYELCECQRTRTWAAAARSTVVPVEFQLHSIDLPDSLSFTLPLPAYVVFWSWREWKFDANETKLPHHILKCSREIYWILRKSALQFRTDRAPKCIVIPVVTSTMWQTDVKNSWDTAAHTGAYWFTFYR